MQPQIEFNGQGLTAIVRAKGSSAEPYLRRLAAGYGSSDSVSNADQADALHLLGAFHGRLPGLIDHAANSTQDSDLRLFLIRAGTSFALERASIAKLTMLTGPVPSTPGEAQCTSALDALAHSLDLLGQSERQGCSAGAALALLADWYAVRPALEAVAMRRDFDISECKLPAIEEISAMADHLTQDPRQARAAAFGIDQILSLHSSFWMIMVARADARAAMQGG